MNIVNHLQTWKVYVGFSIFGLDMTTSVFHFFISQP